LPNCGKIALDTWARQGGDLRNPVTLSEEVTNPNAGEVSPVQTGQIPFGQSKIHIPDKEGL